VSPSCRAYDKISNKYPANYEVTVNFEGDSLRSSRKLEDGG
jgi:hypothetical protein